MQQHPVTFPQQHCTNPCQGALDLRRISKCLQVKLTFILLPAVVGRPFLSACRFSGNKDFIKGLAEERQKGLAVCVYLGGETCFSEQVLALLKCTLSAEGRHLTSSTGQACSLGSNPQMAAVKTYVSQRFCLRNYFKLRLKHPCSLEPRHHQTVERARRKLP